jgi:hypothetical protein
MTEILIAYRQIQLSCQGAGLFDLKVKVKFYLRLIKHHAVSCELHTPAVLSPEKELLVHLLGLLTAVISFVILFSVYYMSSEDDDGGMKIER